MNFFGILCLFTFSSALNGATHTYTPEERYSHLTFNLLMFGTTLTIENHADDGTTSGHPNFPTQSFDDRIREKVHGEKTTAKNTDAEESFHQLSNATILTTLLTPVGTLIFDDQKSFFKFFALTHAFALNGLVTTAGKYTIKRRRPKTEHAPKPIRNKSAYASFPSGHASNAFTGATIYSLLYPESAPWVRYGLYAMASTTAYLRMRADKHFFTDVAIGGLIGTGSAFLGYHSANGNVIVEPVVPAGVQVTVAI